MFEWKASNAVFLDENTGGKGKYFRARILQAGLVKYSFGVCLLEKDTIDKFIYEFVGCPVIIDHKDVTNENAKEERVGVISRVWFEQMDGWFWVEGVIFEEEAISLINDGYNVSCQYEISEYANNIGNQLHNGNPYDKVILNGKPEHLAIVKNPRYENAMIAVNALDATNKDDEKGRWITVKGTHVFIPKGKTIEEVIDKKFGDSEAFEAKRTVKIHKDIHDRYEALREESEKQKKALEGKYAKEDADFDVDQLKKDIREAQSFGYEEVEDIAEFLGLDEDEVRETLAAKDEQEAGQFDHDDYRKFLEKERSQKLDKQTKAKMAYDEAAKQRKRFDSLPPTDNKSQQKAREVMQKILDTNLQDAKDKVDKAKNTIIEAINEIKETDMFSKLFKKKENKMDKDELKSLFMECLSELTAKNEKDEEDKKADNEEDMKADEDKKDEKEDAENKCKNDVVDKRDIIRQIMAIAGKHEDNEDVRTIAKLAEKLAYDKSEADDKADNKCKNEDEEDEDKKEKASNSIEEIVGKMSAGVNEYKPQSYLSQKKAIELGDKLF